MILFYTFIVLIIVAAVLLVIVVLMQNSKGGGVSSQFGGSGASQLIGVKKTGDLLEKLTWGFAIAILALSLSSNVLIDRNAVNSSASPDAEEIIKTPSTLPTQGNDPLKTAPKPPTGDTSK